MSKQKGTLAIVGSHPMTSGDAPFQDLSVDIWVFNSAPISDWCKRCTAVFEIHPAGEYTNPMAHKSEYWQWLQDNYKIPVYMAKHDPRVQRCIEFPIEEIIDQFLPNFKRRQGDGEIINKYFTSSACYALALALKKGYKRIELYGIEMETNSEYIYQRDGVGLWIGIALGLGVEVVICEHSSMFAAPLYGYDDDHKQIGREDFEESAKQLERALENAQNEHKIAQGRLDEIIRAIETAKAEGRPEAEIMAMGEAYGQRTQEFEQSIAKFADINGQLKLCRFFLAKIEKMMIANGRALEVTALRSEKMRAVGMVG